MVNKRMLLITLHKEFPGGPVVRTWHFDCSGSTPCWGTKILQTAVRLKNKHHKKTNFAHTGREKWKEYY